MEHSLLVGTEGSCFACPQNDILMKCFKTPIYQQFFEQFQTG